MINISDELRRLGFTAGNVFNAGPADLAQWLQDDQVVRAQCQKLGFEIGAKATQKPTLFSLQPMRGSNGAQIQLFMPDRSQTGSITPQQFTTGKFALSFKGEITSVETQEFFLGGGGLHMTLVIDSSGALGEKLQLAMLLQVEKLPGVKHQASFLRGKKPCFRIDRHGQLI